MKDHEIRELVNQLRDVAIKYHGAGQLREQLARVVRAHMLQAGNPMQPELTVWYGSMPESNGKSNWTAILHRKGECLSTGITIDRSEYPDRVRYEADRMRYLIGELADEPDILEYDADAHSGYVPPAAAPGNSPVIPDGYVMVPKEPTDDMCFAPDVPVGNKTWDGYQSSADMAECKAIYEAMLAAAPQSPGSEPATVPGKWIPVSEQLPDDDDFVYIWPRPDFGVELHVGQYCECSPKGEGWYAQIYEQNYGVDWYPITVTHWMPLPAAPQEVSNEK